LFLSLRPGAGKRQKVLESLLVDHHAFERSNPRATQLPERIVLRSTSWQWGNVIDNCSQLTETVLPAPS
jgi:hypothetical protein